VDWDRRTKFVQSSGSKVEIFRIPLCSGDLEELMSKSVFLFLFFNFVMLSKCQSCIRVNCVEQVAIVYLAKFGDFQNTKVENLKHLFSYSKQFLQILAKNLDFFSFFGVFFQERGIYDIIVVFQKNHKWRKSPKKITGLSSNFVKRNLSKYADFSTFSHHTFLFGRRVKIPQIKHGISRKDVSDEVNSLHCHFHCQGPQY
jgi:hypothetical protein